MAGFALTPEAQWAEVCFGNGLRWKSEEDSAVKTSTDAPDLNEHLPATQETPF
jgi:hypothetical protein